MKIRKIQWVNLVIALLFTPLLFAQNNKPAPGNFDRFVQEVYTGQGAKTMAEDTRRYAFMKEFYENRITFLESDAQKLEGSNFTKLSQIPLFDDYNKGLVRDARFDPATFNPFKYRLGFYSQERQVIHVDGTKYVIVIQPQTRRGSN